MGSEAVPGSQAALARLRQAGLECRFVTNTTKDTISNLLALVQALGFDIQRQEVGSALLCVRVPGCSVHGVPSSCPCCCRPSHGNSHHHQPAAGFLLAHRH